MQTIDPEAAARRKRQKDLAAVGHIVENVIDLDGAFEEMISQVVTHRHKLRELDHRRVFDLETLKRYLADFNIHTHKWKDAKDAND